MGAAGHRGILSTMSSTTISVAGRDLSLTCHSGLRAGRGLPNSLEGIRDSLDAGVFRIEIDVHSMADGDFLVSHASRLDESTTASGSVGRLTRDEALALQRKDDSNARPPLLSEVVALAEQYASELQLDLKDWRPLTPERVRALVALMEPLGERAIVSSGQDWNLRAIAGYTNSVRLGFDPDHYLAAESRRVPVPARLGAYAYRDDHPLAIGRSQPVDEYLRQRIDDLLSKCPNADEFFVEFRLLVQAADEGVSLPELLHDRGVAVSAWTLDYEGGKSIATLKKLSSIGVDCVTTNTSQQFVEALTA